MEDSQPSRIDGCRRLKGIDASSCRLTADQPHTLIPDKMIEAADGIGTAACLGDLHGRIISQKRVAAPGPAIDRFLWLPGNKKESCLQDSPPAAGRFSDILPLRRSAILSGAFFMS